MGKVIYSTEPKRLDKKRYLVYFKSAYGGWHNASDANYRTYFFAWLNAKSWESIGYEAKIVDSWVTDNE